MRGINQLFINDLLDGKLCTLLKFVRNDNTLDLEIREGYLNIYYRGGNALKVTQINSDYLFEFDKNFFTENKFRVEKLLNEKIENYQWFEYFSVIKQWIDFYFTKNKKEEREFQQLVVRINNYSSLANSTDYFIVDIEYDNSDNARFDLVAIEWPSIASQRKLAKDFKPKLVIIEKKFGDGSLSGTAGMKKHLEDFKKFVSDAQSQLNFKNEMLGLFRQKRELGLIPCLSKSGNSNDVTEFNKEIGLAFLIANHDAASSILDNEIKSLDENLASFFVSNFSGYGLYKANLFKHKDFNAKFLTYIYELQNP